MDVNIDKNHRLVIISLWWRYQTTLKLVSFYLDLAKTAYLNTVFIHCRWDEALQNMPWLVWYKVCIKYAMKAVVTWHKRHNTPISQISQCIRQASHNTPYCNQNVHTYANFFYKAVLVEIRDLVHCEICAASLFDPNLGKTGYQVWKSTTPIVILLLKTMA